MSKLKPVNKEDQKNVEASGFYFALKSKNEVYFQMASIFREITNEEDEFAKKIFKGMLTGEHLNILLEKSF